MCDLQRTIGFHSKIGFSEEVVGAPKFNSGKHKFPIKLNAEKQQFTTDFDAPLSDTPRVIHKIGQPHMANTTLLLNRGPLNELKVSVEKGL